MPSKWEWKKILSGNQKGEFTTQRSPIKEMLKYILEEEEK